MLEVRPSRRPLFWLVLTACLSVVPTWAEAPMEKQMSGTPLDAPHDPGRCAPDGVGLGGYDAVSYRFADGPRPGREELYVEHAGIRYLFASAENRRTFLVDPVRYLPRYRGWCAMTLALGRLTCPDFTNFKIENDQLLLFEVTGFTNGREVWNGDPLRFRQQADTNFDTLVRR